MSVAHSTITDQYLARTTKSAELARAARGVFPNGVTHDARNFEPHGIYVTRAKGSRKWDVDGNEYVDYGGGHGALLLGHNRPEIVAAVEEQLTKGTHFGSNHELEVRWGQLVQEMIPSAERVRFTSSGTEATLLGMRLVRAFTGKPKILRFTGHFHGWHDHAAFGVGSHFDGSPSPGVLPGIAENIVFAPPWDIEETRRVLEAHDDISAVFIEPTGSSWGQVPVMPEFLSALREITAERGVLLVFDEVITGFRVSPGGAQAEFGVTPDLTTLAKIIAGGFNGGALVGRKDVLDWIDLEASAEAGNEKIAHHGTYNANPISAVAGITMLEIVRDTDACRQANDYAQRLRDAMNGVLADEDVNWSVYGTFSGFHIFTNPEEGDITPEGIAEGKFDYHTLKVPPQPGLIAKLRMGMMIHGADPFVWPGGVTSTAHTDEDLNITAEAFRGALKLLKEEGEL